MRAQVGQIINGKYRLLRLIGDGGMGSVYEARHEVLGTSVALKFLHPELTNRTGLVQRFVQEARVSAQIQSSHVVRVTDVDQTPAGGAFIVMEYLEGRTLQVLYEDLYRSGRRLSYVDALEYAMQMLEGVEAAHKAGIVHRDLKPDNVMITEGPKGRPLLKLLDFGIAKLKASSEYDRGLTRPGVIMGTPEYMAPEQAFSADAVDARADIFSLGVMIFEMLGGRRPVGGDEPQVIANAYLSGQIARLVELAPHVPPGLADAVHHAMAPHVKDRWSTVTELRDAIEPFAAEALTPSVSSNISLSDPDRSRSPAPVPVTPPATNVGAEMQKALGVAGEPEAGAGAPRVPKTLPPSEGVPDTNQCAPPAMSSPVSAEAEASLPQAGYVPPTRSVDPYVPAAPVDEHAATAFAAPYVPLPAPERPSGTAVGDAAMISMAASEPALPLGPSAYAPASLAAPQAPTARKARRASTLRSLPAILLLAAGVSGAVMGGMYLAQDSFERDDPDDGEAPPPPKSATIPADPPPTEEPPPPPPPTVAPPPPTLFKPVPTAPRKPPPPKGSGSPTPPPPPSTNPSARPILPIPIIIPTSIPFPPLPLPI